MKYIKYIVLAAFLSIVQMRAADWNTYLSYSEVQQIVPTEKFLFVMASDGVYSYNRHDHSVNVYSKANILSDVQVKYIAWSKAVKKLVIVYSNGNIDLMNEREEIENISDYYAKSITDDKTINSIFIKDNLMLLATGFGVVKVDLRKCEIVESYKLNANITKTDISDGNIYALSSDNKLYIGKTSDNLLDVSRWKIEQNKHQFPDWIEKPTNEEKEIVNSLKIDGPKNNQISRLKFYDNRLFIAAGGMMEEMLGTKEKVAALHEYSNGEWTYYDPYQPVGKIYFTREVNDIAIDPKDSKHIFVSTFGNGLYEFMDGKQLNHFTISNVDLLGAAAGTDVNYVRTGGVCFYPPTNDLYFLNLETKSALLKLNTSGEFENVYHSELFGLNSDNNKSWANMKGTICDSRNLLWFVNDNYLTPALYCYDAKENTLKRYNTFVNQDGTTIADLNYVRCVTEDLEHNIWIGTEQGPLMLTPSLMEDNKAGFIQVKVPRNDGTNYADYLLAGVDVTCITIDPAGRKWIGTNGNGAYLISADNMEQIEHFTEDNSSILSNNIRDIAVNDKTGEVFFASNNGLCSYSGSATQAFPELNKDNIWAYPNPVTPRYNGDITIVGLSMNSSVTITTSSGHIVASGKSTGGSFKWDGCDKSGKRVASGVYMVHTATADGKSGIVTKIAVIK